jgi:hypothetical protein
MKTHKNLQEMIQQRCSNALIGSVGKLYVRLYDCMAVMRLFL